MNITEIMANVTPEQILKLEQNMGKIVPMIESKLPMLKGIEDAWRKEFNLNESDIFIYSAIKSPDNKKIFIYVQTIFPSPEDVKLSNGRVIKKGSPVFSAEVKSFELLEFVKTLTANGISGLIENLM